MSAFKALAVFLLTACLAWVACKATLLNDAEKAAILARHNQWRASQGASNMNGLAYNESLAILAEGWAEQCIFGHPNGIWPNYTLIGQNLYAISGADLDMNDGCDAWGNETAYYNFTGNSCQKGQQCGHYTQVTWANTRTVGCAYQTNCSYGGYIWTYLFCNYYPPGNYVGQWPFNNTGSSCTNCPSGNLCSAGLCWSPNSNSSTGTGKAATTPAPVQTGCTH